MPPDRLDMGISVSLACGARWQWSGWWWCNCLRDVVLAGDRRPIWDLLGCPDSERAVAWRQLRAKRSTLLFFLCQRLLRETLRLAAAFFLPASRIGHATLLLCVSLSTQDCKHTNMHVTPNCCTICLLCHTADDADKAKPSGDRLTLLARETTGRKAPPPREPCWSAAG